MQARAEVGGERKVCSRTGSSKSACGLRQDDHPHKRAQGLSEGLPGTGKPNRLAVTETTHEAGLNFCVLAASHWKYMPLTVASET